MTFEEYLNHRKDRLFTPGEVVYLLEKCGYCYKFMDTLVAPGKCTWKESGWSLQADAQAEIYRRNKEQVPYHFAYIKFYKRKADGGLFALVAGKTNLFNPDFGFEKIENDDRELDEAAADNAKVFLTRNDCFWYCQGVLAVWQKGQTLDEIEAESRANGPQARKAKAVERDIGGLFGLWGS